MYLLPPADPACSDEDSGDEEKVSPDNLSRRQLEAEGEATVWKGDKRVHLYSPDDDDNNYSLNSSSNIAPTSDAAPSVTAKCAFSPTGSRQRKIAKKTVSAPENALPNQSTSVTAASASGLQQLTSASVATTMSKGTSSSKSKSKKPERNWLKSDMPESCRPPDVPENNQYASTDLTPTGLFEQFVDDEVMQLLTENSNKYAMQKGRHNFVTSQSEMRLFLAILFNSGYAPLPRRRLYWEPLPDVQNTAMSKAITRNRFAELMANVHVANNDSLPPDDRMAKVRPLFTALNSKFVTHFPRHQHLSIDESMVPYYGKHGAKQFIRGKPIRFGYKVWSINSSLGYCVQLDPYQGAGTSIPELGLGGSVVVKLASVLPLDNYVLYFDNFFTSLRLLHHLSVNGVKATGTVRANRIEDCPVMTVDQIKKLPRGTSDHRIDSVSNILVARWHDNSVVTLASNCHGDEPTGTVKQWSSAEKRRVELVQPYLIGEYNKYMGGVD